MSSNSSALCQAKSCFLLAGLRLSAFHQSGSRWRFAPTRCAVHSVAPCRRQSPATSLAVCGRATVKQKTTASRNVARHLSSNSRCRGALCLRCQMRAALSAAAHRCVHALPAQDSSNCLGRCGLPSSARRARMRPNPSLEPTHNGMAPGPRSLVVHLRPRGPAATPLCAAQLKR